MGGKYTKAQAEAAKRYLEKHDQIRIRVPGGKKAEYIERAAAEGKSLNQYIIDCIEKGRE